MTASPSPRDRQPCASAAHMEPFPSSSPSKSTFEYLLLPPRSAPTIKPANSPAGSSYPEGNSREPATSTARLVFRPFIPKSDEFICTPVSQASTEFLVRPRQHSSPSLGPDRYAFSLNPSQKIRVGRRCNPQGDPTNQLPCALRVYSPVDSHTCQTPWSVFQDGPNGEPTGRRPQGAPQVPRGTPGRALPSTIAMMTSPRAYCLRPGHCHHRNPRSSMSRVDRRTGSHRSTSDRDTSPAPIRFPPDNFKHSLTLFSKSFSSFPRGTCSLSVSRQYLALDGIYRPIGAAFPNNPTRRQRLVVRQGPGTTGLSLLLAPFQDWARSATEDASPDYNSDAEGDRFSWWAFPGSAAVNKGILASFFSSAIDMLKLSG
ncbi:Protein TAR1 [Glycine soja]